MPHGEIPENLMGLGLPPFLASALGNTIATVTAAGTTIGAATAIPANAGTALINGQSSQTGASLPNMQVGSWIFIKGTGATAPVIWAPTGTSINANSDNTTGLTLSAATTACIILRASSTKFYSFPLAP